MLRSNRSPSAGFQHEQDSRGQNVIRPEDFVHSLNASKKIKRAASPQPSFCLLGISLGRSAFLFAVRLSLVKRDQIHRDLPLRCTSLAKPEEFLMPSGQACFDQQFAGSKVGKFHIARRVHTFRDHSAYSIPQGISHTRSRDRGREGEDSPDGTSWKASSCAGLLFFCKQVN